jgi:hypothetical protein
MSNELIAPFLPSKEEESVGYLSVRKCVTPLGIQTIKRLIDEAAWDFAYIGGASQPDDEVRKCKQQVVAIASERGEPSFPYKALYDYIVQLNGEHWGLNLVEFKPVDDPSVFLKYEASEASHYKWHMDSSSTTPSRKLTFLIPLTDPSKYEGGDFDIFPECGIEKQDLLALGNLIVFPSNIPHRVTPILAGTRIMVAGWVHGI